MAPKMTSTPYVQVESLVSHYGPRIILDGVSFNANLGEITVILGGSGCGKTTVLRQIVRPELL